MEKFAAAWRKRFFGKELEFKVKLFHVLAITGVIICVIMTGVSLAGSMYISAAINFGAGLVSLFLLLYSARKQRYRVCYTLTLAVIFFILFPSLFFYGGGYKGGMPFFFVFAVVFTVYMLEGWSMVAVSTVEIALYALLCVTAYWYPHAVVPFATEWDEVMDTIIGLVTVSVSLGATMFVQMQMYRRQQRDLEQAQQEAESANRAKSAFLANMSHEIRTPIHMILGMNEIIRRESRSVQVREYAGKIDETSKMLLSLVDSILDVSKIESGKMELIPAPYESEKLVQTLELVGRTCCRKKNLVFQCRVADDLPPMLVGDLAHIRQIGSNFLTNAAKYTETGSITLEVSGEAGRDADEIWLCLSVQDTGIGIRREALPTLFEAFTRVDAESHRRIAGTGLGLAIVRELTDLMGGTVHVESEPGKGSTFSVRLPQKTVPDAQKAQPRQALELHAPGARILVVDDNEGNRTLMQQLLRPTEIQTDTAASGRECLQMVRENSYDMILMDYMMPRLDGLQTMEQLKRLNGFHTPVIALTADATAETKTKLLDSGFSAYLTKPIPWAELQETLVRHLPQDRVRLTESAESCRGKWQMDQNLAEQLQPFGVSLENAMQYFRGGPEEFGAVAGLFVHHAEQEQTRIRSYVQDSDWPGLRFPIHALKGKARNLGMDRLADVCAYVECLCASEDEAQIRSLMPYLLYLWDRGSAGMELLCRSPAFSDGQKTGIAPVDGTPADLQALLRENRRRPALQCIEALKAAEPDPEGKNRLAAIARLVRSIDFSQALAAYEAYLKWKKGGDAF